MNCKFKFDSEDFHDGVHLNSIEITIHVSCSEYKGDATWEIEEIYNEMTEKYLEFDQFSKEDQDRIERMADEVASENAYEAFTEMMIDRAEAAYDAWKEGD
jgi:hypothetical protein